jgi:hypothetical protein
MKRESSVWREAVGKSLICKNVANTLSNPAVGDTLSFASDETRKLE